MSSGGYCGTLYDAVGYLDHCLSSMGLFLCIVRLWTGYLLDLAACNLVVEQVLDAMMLLREVAQPLTDLI